ncbi:MAG: polyprenyl synthetase family protein [Desulfurococcales archaeon]|nr:polyprenyl synthetase family protein [Desulfurococcales archaeon]
MNLDEFAKDFLPRVERYIDQIIRTDIDHLEKASKHLIKAGGKRLRPLMLGLFTKAFDGNLENAAIAGAAVEILHNFTLVHDDIMDRDQFRRGVPTTHVVFGEPMAILAGDYLYAKAYRALLWLKDRVDDHKLVKIIDLLNKASEIVAEGQALDLTLPSYHEVSEEQYIDMIYRKTSSLFMAAAGIGVMLGRSSEQDVEKAIEYARYAGIAFQIRDDILGLLGDPSVTGKPVLNDLREGKRTILVIHAFKEASDFDKNEMLRIIGNKEASIKDLEKAKDLVIKYGGVKKAEDLAKSYLEKALKVLDEIERRALNKDSIYIIKDLMTRLVYREK